MVRSNLHTHSVFSDGKNTIEQLADTAISKGFLTLGISDHSYTDFDDSFCMKSGVFDSYIDKMRELKQKYEGRLELLTGMELDYYSENIDTQKLDYVIGSVHYVKNQAGEWFFVDHGAQLQLYAIEKGFGNSKNAYIKAYYDNVCDHMQKNKPDIAGHFDVITKFSLFDEEDPFYKKTALESIDVVLDFGVVTEINTGAVAKGLRQKPYPNEYILRRIKERNGNVVINADAHVCENIDFYFDESAELLKSAGFKTALMLTKNGFTEYKL